MATYSFLDTYAQIAGPGGSINIGAGAGAAEEGITIEMSGDKTSLTIGADGTGMTNLHADKSGKVTVRLLKTSPSNQLLSTMYALQNTSSSLSGINVITVRNTNLNDSVTARGVSFAKFPTLTYAKDGAMNEWVFNATRIDQNLGQVAAAAI